MLLFNLAAGRCFVAAIFLVQERARKRETKNLPVADRPLSRDEANRAYSQAIGE